MFTTIPVYALVAFAALSDSASARIHGGSALFGKIRSHDRLVEERKLPITATITRTVEATSTYTVWVQETVTASASVSAFTLNSTATATGDSLSVNATATVNAGSIYSTIPSSSQAADVNATQSSFDTASVTSTASLSDVIIPTSASTGVTSYYISSVESVSSVPTSSDFDYNSTVSESSYTATATQTVDLGSEGLVLPTGSASLGYNSTATTESITATALASTFSATESASVVTESTASESSLASVPTSVYSSEIASATDSLSSSTASSSANSTEGVASSIPSASANSSSSNFSSQNTSDAASTGWTSTAAIPQASSTATSMESVSPSSATASSTGWWSSWWSASSTDTATATSTGISSSIASSTVPTSAASVTQSASTIVSEGSVASATVEGSDSAIESTASAFVTDSASSSSSTATASAWWSSWLSASSTQASATVSSSIPSAIASSISESVSAISTDASSIESATSTIVQSASASASTTVTAVTTSASTSSSAATASATTGSSGLSTAQLNTRVTLGYYPDWSVWTYPVSDINWDKLDIVDFAFAIPNSAFGLEFTQYNSEETLTSLVAAGHAAGKRVRLSIGGWTGSVYFSSAVSSAANRQTFAKNIAAVYSTYDLDGIDIDWEYPGLAGAGDNGVSTSDSANFLLFLQVLRSALPSDAFISAATQVWPFADASGLPMSDVSGFAKVLDWITVMNYDIWGSSSTPGPNAPLSDACGTSTQPLANAYAAVSSWTTAGMPANQILLGIAAYGYLQMSTATSLVTRRRRSLEHRAATVTVTNADGGTTDGQVNFASLISQGALVLDSTGAYVGGGGFTREWDSCSSTPWLKSTASGQVVTYDDPQSISLKAQFARQSGLRGTNMWELTGDMSAWSLMSAARSGLGLD